MTIVDYDSVREALMVKLLAHRARKHVLWVQLLQLNKAQCLWLEQRTHGVAWTVNKARC